MKTRLNKNQLNLITKLFNEQKGSRKIAAILKINRGTVQRAFKQLKLDTSKKYRPKIAYKQTEKNCKICNITKNIIEFRKRIKLNRVSFESNCLVCEKFSINENNKKRIKFKRKNNVNFCLKLNVSYSIWKALNKNNLTKNNKSCLNYLDYSLEELKNHLEKQFEPWMNWNNKGKYIKKDWKDTDSSTWKWQIDHIIPQSQFSYISMEDKEFKKCWSLDNLRPLSAKQNMLDGTKRTRHIII